MRRRAILASLPAVCALGAPHAAQLQGGNPTPIVIGQSAPVSGPLARVGIAVRDAARAVFADTNAQGGIGGREITLVTLDDEDRAERTAVNVKLLASQHQVLALFGFVGAGAHRAGARGA